MTTPLNPYIGTGVERRAVHRNILFEVRYDARWQKQVVAEAQQIWQGLGKSERKRYNEDIGKGNLILGLPRTVWDEAKEAIFGRLGKNLLLKIYERSGPGEKFRPVDEARRELHLKVWNKETVKRFAAVMDELEEHFNPDPTEVDDDEIDDEGRTFAPPSASPPGSDE